MRMKQQQFANPLKYPLSSCSITKNKHTFDKNNIPLLRMCVNWEKEVREVEERTEMERLETAILNFIEKTVNEPVSEKDVEILPALAHELIELWKI